MLCQWQNQQSIWLGRGGLTTRQLFFRKRTRTLDVFDPESTVLISLSLNPLIFLQFKYFSPEHFSLLSSSTGIIMRRPARKCYEEHVPVLYDLWNEWRPVPEFCGTGSLSHINFGLQSNHENCTLNLWKAAYFGEQINLLWNQPTMYQFALQSTCMSWQEPALIRNALPDLLFSSLLIPFFTWSTLVTAQKNPSSSWYRSSLRLNDSALARSLVCLPSVRPSVRQAAFTSSLNQRYLSAYLCRQAGISFVEFKATSPAAKQHPHFQQVLWASGLSSCQAG